MWTTLAALSLALSAPLAPAVEEDAAAKAQSEAYRASVAQDSLRRDAEAIKLEFESLRGELRQFLPDQVDLVERAFKQLETLSQNEMVDAVASLRQASSAEDMKARLTALADAQKDQSVIGSSLKQLAVDLKAQQTAEQLAESLRRLVRSQAISQAEMERVLLLPNRFEGKGAERAKAAVTEQGRVTEDIRTLNTDLVELKENLPQGPTGAVLSQVISIAEQKRLLAGAESVMKQLEESNIEVGIAGQKVTLDTLVEMLNLIESATSTSAERLKALAAQVREAAAAQRDLAQSEQMEKKPQAKAEEQKALADVATGLAPLLQPLNNQAADEVRDAKAQMEASKDAAQSKEKEEKAQAADLANAAADKLDAAATALEDQVAKIESEAMPDTNTELANTLANLKNATDQAAKDQENSAQNGQPNEALQNQVEEIQKYAAAVSPDAAASLGEAAEAMNTPGQESQQQAAESLAEASKELGEQLADLNGTSQEAQALDAAESHVDAAIKAAAEAEKNAGAEAPNAGETVADLNEAGQNTVAAEQALKNSGASPEAQEALASAKGELVDSKKAASEGKMPEAGSEAASAQESLAQAKGAIGEAKAALAQQAAAAMTAQAQSQQGPPGPPQPGQPQGAQPQNQLGQAGQSPSKNGPEQAGASTLVDGTVLQNSGNDFTAGPVVAGLNETDRQAVAQLQEQKPPRDFVPAVQQYYKNLADGAGM